MAASGWPITDQDFPALSGDALRSIERSTPSKAATGFRPCGIAKSWGPFGGLRPSLSQSDRGREFVVEKRMTTGRKNEWGGFMSAAHHQRRKTLRFRDENPDRLDDGQGKSTACDLGTQYAPHFTIKGCGP